MTEERFAEIYDVLERADCTCDMTTVLSTLPDHELQTVFGVFVDQYGQELAAGALERSDGLCGTFIINGNQSSIYFLWAAVRVMKTEMERRDAGGDLPGAEGHLRM
jgi:hypothetical protein